MSGANPLVGLIGNYESASESETEADTDAGARSSRSIAATSTAAVSNQSTTPVTHPAPIPHCPWSACYDEGSGFTYYWHQVTNEVTWETPPEYLLALKVASHQLNSTVQNEVTAEEWQLYQQALIDKQKASQKPALSKPAAPPVAKQKGQQDEKNNSRKRRASSDSEEEKIELITSYYHSDSESNDESESPVKCPTKPEPVVVKPPIKSAKNVSKKPKAKPVMEYGPTLPPNQEYSLPIGPELPPEFAVGQSSEEMPSEHIVPVSESKADDRIGIIEEKSNGASLDGNTESQDEEKLMEELLNKAKILQNLGGELPSDLKNLIRPDKSGGNSPGSAPLTNEASRESHSTLDTNIDDLLEEIEKKEMPKRLKPKKTVEKIDMFSDDANFPSNISEDISPNVSENVPVKKIEGKPLVPPLFPSSTGVLTEPTTTVETPVPSVSCLFPSANNEETALLSSAATTVTESKAVDSVCKVTQDKKGVNMYVMSSEGMELVPKKRKRISSSVLPPHRSSEIPVYTTKYSQYIDGFSGERTGLGFSKADESEELQSKKSFSYGNYLKFTKGETLNEEKVEEDAGDKENIESLSEIMGSKLRFLNQQSVLITPVQEMTIQMQSLSAAFSVGALTVAYWRGWLTAAAESLARLEASAAPPGWICEFHREEGQYRYRRTWDGHTQYEYPAPEPGGDDMDICTTPPPLPHDPPPPPPPPSTPASAAAVAPTPPPKKKQVKPPPPPHSLPLPIEPPPPPPVEPPMKCPAPPTWTQVPPPPPPPAPPAWTAPPPPPPPPAWNDAASPPPPPPGCEDEAPKLTIIEQEVKTPPHRKESLGDELMSFYNDIAELEKSVVPPPPEPEPPAPTPVPAVPEVTVPLQPPKQTSKEDKSKMNSQQEANSITKPVKKKSKVKISGGMGMKQKTVSNLVAKWQQVQDEINSD